MVTSADIRLRLAGFLPWDDRIEPEIGSTGPAPGSGAIELPERLPLPVRTRLEPAGGAARLVGRIVDPDGQPRPLIVRWNRGALELIEVDEPPLGLAARSGGAWSIGREQLTAVTSRGAVLTRVGVSGIRILGTQTDAAWVCGLGSCTYVTASGSPSEFRLPWRDGFDACLDGESLTGWDPDQPGGIVTINPKGIVRRRDIGVERALFERPLAFGEHEALSAALRTLVHRGPGGNQSMVMAGAGLRNDGVPFFAGHIGNRTWLWQGSSAAIPVEPPLAEHILAVLDGRVLVRSGRTARWWDMTSGQPGADVDDEPEAIVRLGWVQNDPYPFVAAENGELLVATSGPDGVAILGMHWPPLS